jgi:hypothetical protein
MRRATFSRKGKECRCPAGEKSVSEWENVRYRGSYSIPFVIFQGKVSI